MNDTERLRFRAYCFAGLLGNTIAFSIVWIMQMFPEVSIYEAFAAVGLVISAVAMAYQETRTAGCASMIYIIISITVAGLFL